VAVTHAAIVRWCCGSPRGTSLTAAVVGTLVAAAGCVGGVEAVLRFLCGLLGAPLCSLPHVQLGWLIRMSNTRAAAESVLAAELLAPLAGVRRLVLVGDDGSRPAARLGCYAVVDSERGGLGAD